MSANVKDMTSGKPMKMLISFALPLMFGNIFQQLYTIVDTIVVGKGLGVNALAALGAVDWFNWMVLGVATGFTQGFSILIAQYFGAKKFWDLRKTLAMSAILSAVIAVVTLIASQAAAKPMLVFLNTPEYIIEDSLSYVRVAFSGIIVIMAYNLLAAVLRALGDSKTPLIAMMIAAAVNVILDVIFVIGLGWGVASAAAATVIAQAFSALYCFNTIRKIPILKLERQDWHIKWPMAGKLFKLGLPIALQNILIAVGGMTIQSVVNRYGLHFVAGFTATNKLYGLLELAAIAFGFAISTYASQNMGARKYGRIPKGVHASLIISAVTSALISAIVLIFGRQILSMFISGSGRETEMAMDVAQNYLTVMGITLFILYLVHVYRNVIQGLGDTLIPMLSGIMELVMRVGVVLILPAFFGENSLYFAELAAWIGADILLISAYHIRMRKLKKIGDAHQTAA